MNKTINFPTSISGQKCIGKCYKAKTIIHHPSTLQEITSNVNFCPTHQYFTIGNGGTKIKNITAECTFPNNNDNDDDLSLFIPSINFDSSYFLNVYYKISTLEEAIEWIDNNNKLPLKTQQRVFDNAMESFGNDLNIVDHRIASFVNKILLYNINTLYESIVPYCSIEKENVILKDKLNNIQNGKIFNNDQKELILLFIKKTFLGIENVHKFLIRFIKYYSEKRKSQNMSVLLTNLFIEYVTKKITMTIESTQ